MQSEQEAIDFLTKLVQEIDMKIIKGPFSSYVDKDGNKGLTAIVMIETSHIAFHIWDEVDPGLLQFDLYTCGSLDTEKVFYILGQHFTIDSMDYKLFDREDGFVVEQEGSLRDGVFHIIYPDGLQLDEKALDPNVGGWFKNKKENE